MQKYSKSARTQALRERIIMCTFGIRNSLLPGWKLDQRPLKNKNQISQCFHSENRHKLGYDYRIQYPTQNINVQILIFIRYWGIGLVIAFLYRYLSPDGKTKTVVFMVLNFMTGYPCIGYFS